MAQDISDHIVVGKNPFINAFVLRKGPVYPVYTSSKTFGKPSIDQVQSNEQVLFKTPKYCYIFISSTGRLYQLQGSDDSSFRFNRIDVTKGIFYNIDAVVFTVGEDVYNFGGYGFWKTNGALRKFNFKDKEWDIVPLSEEIIPQIYPMCPVWINNETQRVYVPFQMIVNNGVKAVDATPGKVVKDAYVLDMHNLSWEKKGRVSEKFFDLFNHFGVYDLNYQDSNGRLFFYLNSIYWLDYNHNQVLVLDDLMRVQSMDRSIGGARKFRYLYNGVFYSYDPFTSFYDSMKLDLSQFKSASFPIWERDFTSWYLLGAVFMVLLGVFYALRRWPIITRSGEKNITISRNALLIELNEQEVRLLKLLLAKSENGENSNIDEINYVLGIKDKNMGIQKKVRSDVINRLNQKYALLSGEGEHLISSIRSEEDKRYFEYFIVPEKLPVIKGILQSKAADSTP